MKRILTSLAMCAATLAPPLAFGTSESSNFQVTVTLSSRCAATNSNTLTADFGTYVAFQTTPIATNIIDLTFTCTRGFAPASVAFDTLAGTADGGGVFPNVNLNYDLNIGPVTVTQGTNATATDIGTATTRTYPVSGYMAPGQAGNCAVASCGPDSMTRTLILTF